jgi:hypothetical protein
MIGRFDFEDALRELFKIHGASTLRPLSDLSGRILYMGIRQLIHSVWHFKPGQTIYSQVGSLTRALAKHNIDLYVVDQGLEDVNRENFIPLFSKLHIIDNRFHYLNMVSAFRHKITAEDRDLFLENEKIQHVEKMSSFYDYAYRIPNLKDIRAALAQKSVKFTRSPQSILNQLLYFHQSCPGSVVSCSLNLFLFNDVKSIACELNGGTSSFIEHDFARLTNKLGMTTKMFRKCLIGALMYFYLDEKISRTSIYLEAYTQNQGDFEKSYL